MELAILFLRELAIHKIMEISRSFLAAFIKFRTLGLNLAALHRNI